MVPMATGSLSGVATRQSGTPILQGLRQAGHIRCSSSSSCLARSGRSLAAAWTSSRAGLLRSSLLPAAAGRRSLSAMAVAAPAAAAPAKDFAKEAHGFELVQQQFVREYDSHVLMYKHKKTGAELISVVNGDENKTFGAVFRTPVSDSTGIPHILEHSVLCGSRKYPIKEPFVELMKGSLNTFLNAFTYPDRTCYPVASTNTQDFYNLVDVYLDAVLHPRCISDKRTFEQEGWHLELDDAQDPLSYKGVVFNEMKGVYSSPDSMFYRVVQQALFPDNTYNHDSGGDPEVIPQLTFEQFQDFHARYYHPSNGRFWFYGDDDADKRLQILDAYLSEFDARPVDSEVATQPLLPEPRSVTAHYAAGEAEEGDGKAYASLNWVLTQEPLDVETELALGFLDYLLLGTPAAPLRKALNDSGLGAALVGGGVDDELKQPIFCVGLKGVEPSNTAAVEKLILDKLAELAATGFTAGAIEAAVNTIEFSLRENNTGSFPRGLSLMLRAVGAWIYGRDPYTPIQWEEALNSFKAKLAGGSDVFGPLIHRFLLDNPHRISVVMLPDSALAAKTEEGEKARLEAIRAQLSEQELKQVVAETAALKERQETPDPPEALTCIPSLQLSDIPKTITKIPTATSGLAGGATLLTHELFTNDVLYAEAALDMNGLPASLLPLLPLFCRSLTQMGTQKESFIELTERIGRKTGGISVYPFTSAKRGQEQPVSYLMVRGKAMGQYSGDLFELMGDILATARLDDKPRFTQMVAETKANMEAGIIGSGHRYAASRLAAQRSIAGWVGEATGGLSYLEFIRGLAKRVEEDWEGVQADLESIRKHLLQRKGALVNLTGDDRALAAAAAHVDALLTRLPEAAAGSNGSGWSGVLPRVNEALVVPTQVNYVGKAANLYADAGYQLSGSAYVIEKHLGTSWLWDKVRVVGGAYGGFCSFDSHSGMFTFLSYRDPNLLDTLEAYDGSIDFLRGVELDQDALTKAIIGTMGDLDAYQLPDAKGYTAFSRYLLGVTDEERQERREQVLGTSLKDFRAFAEVLDCVRGDAARVVAVTNADKAAQVLQEKPGFWEVRKVL
uniref:Peptidase M16C associated domain-containing protein n=1 Tax=Tetradesmus obliquus TaxID=3088 RepID=A0A383WCE6_TETOB|eukprot:jgi/Sobl393_1/15243/SZX75111.1